MKSAQHSDKAEEEAEVASSSASQAASEKPGKHFGHLRLGPVVGGQIDQEEIAECLEAYQPYELHGAGPEVDFGLYPQICSVAFEWEDAERSSGRHGGRDAGYLEQTRWQHLTGYFSATDLARGAENALAHRSGRLPGA